MKRRILFILLTIGTIAYSYRGLFISPAQEKKEIAGNFAEQSADLAAVAPVKQAQPAKKTAQPKKQPKARPAQQETIVRHDIVCMMSEFEEDFLACVAYTESFSYRAYQCRGQRLIGFGQSRINGKKIHAGDTVDLATAKANVIRHLRRDLLPCVRRAMKRPLENEGQLLACCLLAYNMGIGNFQNSGFVSAYNAGQPIEVCFAKIAGTGGVKKRRWVDEALFTGAITADDLLSLKAAGIYNFSKNDLFSYGGADLSAEKVSEILNSNLNQVGDWKVSDLCR